MLAVVTGVATGPRGHGPFYLFNKEENEKGEKESRKGRGEGSKVL